MAEEARLGPRLVVGLTGGIASGKSLVGAMFVKLGENMTSDDYVAAVKAGADFPDGALDYSGPGLASPGETTEIWGKTLTARMSPSSGAFPRNRSRARA